MSENLIEYLSRRYREELAKAGHDPVQQDEALRSAQDFCNFAEDYLRQHPPSQVNYLDGGIGLTLMDQAVVLVAPRDNIAASPSQGGMQPSYTVPVTGSDTLRDLKKSDKPDFEQIEQGQDLTQGSGAVNYRLPTR